MNKRYVIIFVVFIIVVFSLILFYSFQKKEIKKIEKKIDISYINICENISTSEMKLTCLAIFTSNPLICEKLGKFNSYCYETVFSVMKNVSENLCENLMENSSKNLCFHELAILKKDSAICNKTAGRYQWCCGDLAKITNNPKLCEEIDIDFERYECLADVTKNVSICEQIDFNKYKVACKIKLGKITDAKKCNDVVSKSIPTYKEEVQECVLKVALTIKDVSLCDLIDAKETRVRCLAQLSEDIQICEKIEGIFWEDLCKVEFIKSAIERELYPFATYAAKRA